MAQLIPVDPFDLIIVGGNGDLAVRKLIPSVSPSPRKQFSDDSRIVRLVGSRSRALPISKKLSRP